MPLVEVCFSPALYDVRILRNEHITVVVDVLRATTAFCAAFEAGVECILPLREVDEVKAYAKDGFLTAAEREGQRVDFADFGNSPTLFLQSDLRGRKLAYTTTNGTKAIELAKLQGPLFTAAFVNLNAVIRSIASFESDILVLCSGWKDSFSLEDTVCAGALADALVQGHSFSAEGDTALAAMELWQEARKDLQRYCSKGSHYKRLELLGLLDDLRHCFQLNVSAVVPFWKDSCLQNAAKG